MPSTLMCGVSESPNTFVFYFYFPGEEIETKKCHVTLFKDICSLIS